MDLEFRLHDVAGTVEVTVGPTTDPAALGAWHTAEGLAHCHAAVRHPARGYAAMLGWIQLVRSTDNGSRGARFEMDPLMFLGEVPHPFAFFGIKPTLFDAPARESRADLDWLAHSFLCRITGIDGDVRTVEPVTGFGWGFAVAGGAATVRAAHPLTAGTWEQHRELLHAAHPGWRFAAGAW